MTTQLQHSHGNAPLSVKDIMTLDFERARWKYAGAKDQAIRHLFSESATRYYQRLNGLLRNPHAMAHDPLLVRRLRRLRERRQQARSSRRFEDLEACWPVASRP